MSNTQPDHNSRYDVVIVGGGIQGCGCAQAIAAAGYSVLLVEKNELASGTSSRSSKLIHGGLRYLETGQFSLVRKSLNERSLLAKLAPSLVKLKKFYLPVYKKQRLGRWQLGAGLSLYSLLGNLRRESRFSLLPKSEWQSLGGLKTENLRCVYQYFDAQTDDVLLTRAVAQSAIELGATIREHSEFICADLADDSRIHVTLRSNSGQASNVHCSLVINAGGPWINEVQNRISFARIGLPSIALVQGTHIELDQPINEGIFYVESPIDARPVFIMPWPSGTLVGTTEKSHTEAPETSRPSEPEIDYLKQTLLHYFPEYQGKITASWSGLRVLPGAAAPANQPRAFSNRARDTIVHQDNADLPRVISLYGGKLTAYRTTAEEVAATSAHALGKLGVMPSRPARNTAEIPLQAPATPPAHKAI